VETKQKYVLALDLGTTGNRAIIFDENGEVVGQSYGELTQYYPHPGWLEHDPMEIWHDTRSCMEQVFRSSGVSPQEIAAMGLAVQRETCLLWNKTTGEPLHRAIVWQDRRTAQNCQELAQKGYAEKIQDSTGLVLDAYFSASKLAWLLDWVKENKPEVNLEKVLAGTIDTWILWNLTGRRVHGTDHSNASRTMLMNLETHQWDRELLDLFQIPAHLMPEIRPSLGDFGVIDEEILGTEIPIRAVFGDQQAALYAHGCNQKGMLKCTYGTGCFLISQSGQELTRSRNQLLSTVAWSEANSNHLVTNYALEGAMFTTGACIQWLRDGLKLIKSAPETEILARQVEDSNGVYFVPALSGLGTPHWDMNARGAFVGITGGVQREHIVRAVLESIAFQVKEVVDAMNHDSDTPISLLKVDGGASQNNFLMEFQAEVLGIPVERPAILDATAQGAAFGAGLVVGFWDNYEGLVAKGRRPSRSHRSFIPSGNRQKAQDDFLIWQKAVERAKNWIG